MSRLDSPVQFLVLSDGTNPTDSVDVIAQFDTAVPVDQNRSIRFFGSGCRVVLFTAKDLCTHHQVQATPQTDCKNLRCCAVADIICVLQCSLDTFRTDCWEVERRLRLLPRNRTANRFYVADTEHNFDNLDMPLWILP